ncbi:NUDIX hydrolase, partial [Aquicoccus sp. SCR17]|nr:NUDIX hydrolase [Carideicomes alvinocaridis]
MSADPAGLLLPVPEQEEDLTRQWLDRRFRQV